MGETVTVAQITGFTLAVADPQRSSDFYCEGLGFRREAHDARGVTVSLDGVRVVLRQTDGALLHAPPCANSPDFQHFAVRVSDMAEAFARVGALRAQAISRGGPQRLPPADGSVTAWKFRDPDGHPLELLEPASAAKTADAPLFIAIDHTAIACADPSGSHTFYQGLGLRAGEGTHNQGPAQDRLDALDGADLDISTAYTAAHGPHVEFLHYATTTRGGPSGSSGAADFITTHLAAKGPQLPSRLIDPDGHLLSLHPAGDPAG